MRTYHVTYRYSRDGSNWVRQTSAVQAESDYAAMSLIESRYYPYVQVISVRQLINDYIEPHLFYNMYVILDIVVLY